VRPKAEAMARSPLPLPSLLPLLLLLLLPQTWAFVPFTTAASSFRASTARTTTTAAQRRADSALRMAAGEQVKTRLCDEEGELGMHESLSSLPPWQVQARHAFLPKSLYFRVLDIYC